MCFAGLRKKQCLLDLAILPHWNATTTRYDILPVQIVHGVREHCGLALRIVRKSYDYRFEKATPINHL